MDSYLDTQLLALCMIKPSFLDKIDFSMLLQDNIKDCMLLIKREYKGDKNSSIGRGWFAPYIDTMKVDIPAFIYNALPDFLETFKEKSADNLETSFNDYMINIKERYQRQLAFNAIEEAKKEISNGNYNEGILKLRELKLRTNKGGSTIQGVVTKFALEDNSFRSGINVWDDEGGLQRGNLMTIVGESGAQKTMFSLWLCMILLEQNPNCKCLYFEKEMVETDIGKRLMSYVLKLNSRDILKKSITKDETQRLIVMTDLLQRYNDTISKDGILQSIFDRFIIVPKHEFNNAEDIWEIVEAHKADFWVLDFMTMLEPKKGYIDDESMRKEVKTLKDMLAMTNSFGIVLSQLKQSNSVSLRTVKIPGLDDMEWGKLLRNLSTWVYSLFYPNMYYDSINELWYYVIPIKTRNGKGRIVTFHSYAQYCQYVEQNAGSQQFTMLDWISGYKNTLKGKKR